MKIRYIISAAIIVFFCNISIGSISFASSFSGADEYDFISDKNKVRSMLSNGDNVAAYEYIRQRLEDDYPENAAMEYRYYTLVNEISLEIGNEYMQVIMTSIDMSRAMYLVSYQQASIQLSNYLLNSAASKGNQDALRRLQANAIVSGFGNQYGGGSTSGYTPSRQNETCSLCKGHGWIPGSSTPTYGNPGTTVCPDCGVVNLSHSHDRCPACMGKGYIYR